MAVDAWTHLSSGIELYFDVLCLEIFLKNKKKTNGRNQFHNSLQSSRLYEKP